MRHTVCSGALDACVIYFWWELWGSLSGTARAWVGEAAPGVTAAGTEETQGSEFKSRSHSRNSVTMGLWGRGSRVPGVPCH